MRAALIPVLGAKFLLELVAWPGTGVLAFQLSGNWLVAFAVPLIVIALWALFIAPKAARRLPLVPLVGGQLLVFAAAAIGFFLADWTIFAIVFIAVVIPVEVLLIATKSYDVR